MESRAACGARPRKQARSVRTKQIESANKTHFGLFGPPAHFTTFGMKIPGIERDGKMQAMEAYLTGDHRLLLTTEAELAWIRGSVSLLGCKMRRRAK